MKTTYTLLFLFFISLNFYGQNLVINEVDADQDGSDMAEFVELYGDANLSLTGYILVFYNGSDNKTSYAASLDGYSLDADGFFVIGNAGVPNMVLELPLNELQNGADAVAIFLDDVANFPNDTPLTSVNLIDYMVYDTDDDDNLDLLSLLDVGQPQLNENELGNGSFHSNSRIPDGGTPLMTTSYTQQTPTPGITNILACDAGSFVYLFEEDFAVCVEDAEESTFEISYINNSEDDTYIFIVTDNVGVIQFTNTTGILDFFGEFPGESLVWGLSYNGVLMAGALDPGNMATDIALDGDGCLALTDQGVLITKSDCSAPVCDSGDVLVNEGGSVFICSDADDFEVTFSNTSTTPEFIYSYVITELDGSIVSFQSSDSFDFDGLGENSWNVYGISSIGAIDAASVLTGEPVAGIVAETCLSLSEATTVTISDCSGGCSDLFFSEYIEGSGNNKALEIYNPMNIPADLSGYTVNLYANGSTDVGNTLTLSGTLESGEVYVIANSSADGAILDLADITASVTNFNGDDAIELVHDGIPVDIIGVIGEDPGTQWPAGEGTTKEHTIVRLEFINEGTTDWSASTSQWTSYGQDDLSFLGSHTANSCGSSDVPSVGFSTSTQAVAEGSMVTVTVNIFNPVYEISVDVDYDGGTATMVDDFMNPFPVTLTFPEGVNDSQEITFLIVDDEDEEDAETIVISLNSDSDDFEITTDIQTITIDASDFVVSLMNIQDVTIIDENGVGTLLGTEVEIHGVVYGLNLRPDGLQFTLIDPTDGIAVFNLDDGLGYTVTEGDSVHVVGTIDQFNGLLQIAANQIEMISADNTLKIPTVITALNEVTESDLVTIECVQIVDPAQWVPGGSGFNVDITNGTETFQLRIDDDVDLFGMEAPQGAFDLIGIGGQYDNTSPYFDGYQILPRWSADITNALNMNYTVEGIFEGEDCFQIGDTGLPAEFHPEFTDGANYMWEFGNLSSTDMDAEFDLFGLDGIVVGLNDVLLTYTLTNANGCSGSITDTLCVEFGIGIEEFEFSLQLYPNPVSDFLIVDSEVNLDFISLRNVLGQIVWTENLNSRNAQVDVSHLPKGLYVLEAVSGGFRMVEEIVVD